MVTLMNEIQVNNTTLSGDEEVVVKLMQAMTGLFMKYAYPYYPTPKSLADMDSAHEAMKQMYMLPVDKTSKDPFR